MAGESSETGRLRYLNATRIEWPLPTFDRLEVWSTEGEKIGRLDGIIIDPDERRLYYFVVDDSRFLRPHRYLLPLSRARVNAEQPALWVQVEQSDIGDARTFDPASFPRFSDDDLNRGDQSASHLV